jgi:hypothetical protein
LLTTIASHGDDHAPTSVSKQLRAVIAPAETAHRPVATQRHGSVARRTRHKASIGRCTGVLLGGKRREGRLLSMPSRSVTRSNVCDGRGAYPPEKVHNFNVRGRLSYLARCG